GSRLRRACGSQEVVSQTPVGCGVMQVTLRVRASSLALDHAILDQTVALTGTLRPRRTSASPRRARTTASPDAWSDENARSRDCSWTNRSSRHGRTRDKAAGAPRYRAFPGTPCSPCRLVSLS